MASDKAYLFPGCCACFWILALFVVPIFTCSVLLLSSYQYKDAKQTCHKTDLFAGNVTFDHRETQEIEDITRYFGEPRCGNLSKTVIPGLYTCWKVGHTIRRGRVQLYWEMRTRAGYFRMRQVQVRWGGNLDVEDEHCFNVDASLVGCELRSGVRTSTCWVHYGKVLAQEPMEYRKFWDSVIASLTMAGLYFICGLCWVKETYCRDG